MKIFTCILKVLLVGFLVVSCEDDEQRYTHTLFFDGNVPEAMYVTYKGYSSHGASADPNGDVILSYTDTEPELVLDSITGWKTGYKIWKVTNQRIGDYKGYTVVLEEIE